MNRKLFLIISTTSVASIGMMALVYIVISSMNPSAKARADLEVTSYYDTSSMSIGSSRMVHIRTWPYFIRRLDQEEFDVYDLVVRYSNENGGGCTAEPSIDQSEHCFIETCRGVYFDCGGNVMEGSHPRALPLHKPKWSFDGTQLHIPNDA